jgi:hypothetical protein
VEELVRMGATFSIVLLVLPVVLQFTILIVFFAMASNIGKLARGTRVQIVLLRLLLRQSNPHDETPGDEKIMKMLKMSSKGETWNGW